MNKEELRIGNLVDFNRQVETVYAIRNSGVDFYKGKTKKSVIMQSYVWEAIKPIPLTEEWLLKFGFSEIGGCNEKDFTNGDYNIFINSIGEVNFLFFREGDWYQKIDYVHQLQNLYFALTGSELTLK